jgi:hypothetical protein
MLAAFATGRLCLHLVSLGNVNGVTTDDSIALVPYYGPAARPRHDERLAQNLIS